MVNLSRRFSEPRIIIEPPRHTPAFVSKCQDCRRGIPHEHLDGSFMVPSSRFARLGRMYEVRRDEAGQYTCDCPFKKYAQAKSECAHIEIARAELTEHPVVVEMQRLRERGVYW